MMFFPKMCMEQIYLPEILTKELSMQICSYAASDQHWGFNADYLDKSEVSYMLLL